MACQLANAIMAHPRRAGNIVRLQAASSREAEPVSGARDPDQVAEDAGQWPMIRFGRSQT